MATIKDFAQSYEPSQMKNIADLEAVSVEMQIKEETRKNKDGEEYTVKILSIGGDEYRVPNSVIEQLKTLLETKPSIKTFKVVKKGEGLNTSYTVVPLEI